MAFDSGWIEIEHARLEKEKLKRIVEKGGKLWWKPVNGNNLVVLDMSQSPRFAEKDSYGNPTYCYTLLNVPNHEWKASEVQHETIVKLAWLANEMGKDLSAGLSLIVDYDSSRPARGRYIIRNGM